MAGVYEILLPSLPDFQRKCEWTTGGHGLTIEHSPIAEVEAHQVILEISRRPVELDAHDKAVGTDTLDPPNDSHMRKAVFARFYAPVEDPGVTRHERRRWQDIRVGRPGGVGKRTELRAYEKNRGARY